MKNNRMQMLCRASEAGNSQDTQGKQIKKKPTITEEILKMLRFFLVLLTQREKALNCRLNRV